MYIFNSVVCCHCQLICYWSLNTVSLAKLGRKKLNCTENLTILVEFIIKNKNRPISARLGVNFIIILSGIWISVSLVT